MLQSSTAARTGHYHTQETQETILIRDDEQISDVLSSLEDPDCQEIINATADTSLTASEIATRCSLPLSTTYRKLDDLIESGFLQTQTRIRQSGKHTSEYSQSVSEVRVSLNSDGNIELTLSHEE